MNHSVLVGLIALSGLGGLWLWSAGARAGAAAQRMVAEVSRTAQVIGTALAVAGLVALVQWAVITPTTTTTRPNPTTRSTRPAHCDSSRLTCPEPVAGT